MEYVGKYFEELLNGNFLAAFHRTSSEIFLEIFARFFRGISFVYFTFFA
jgi:hypothetical protein